MGFKTKTILSLINHDSNTNNIYLFLRKSKKEKSYSYLGNLRYVNHDAKREYPVYFTWELLDWNTGMERWLQKPMISVVENNSIIPSKISINSLSIKNESIYKYSKLDKEGKVLIETQKKAEDNSTSRIVKRQDNISQFTFNIKDVSFSRRTSNALLAHDINTLNQLKTFMLEKDLRLIPNLGSKSINEILLKVDEISEKKSQLFKDLNQEPNPILLELYGNYEIKTLDLSHRAINSLNSIDINNIGDLLKIKKKDIGEIHGIGASTVLEIETQLNLFYKTEDKVFNFREINHSLIKNFTGLEINLSNLNNPIAISRIFKKNGLVSIKDLLQIDKFNFFYLFSDITTDNQNYILDLRESIINANGYQIIDLYNLILTSNNILKDQVKAKAIFKHLSGENTLEKSGQMLGITRERVRQISKKVLNKIDQLKPIIYKELSLINLNYKEPLTVIGLELQNPFFNNISELIKFPKSKILKNIFSNESPLLFEIISKKIIFYKNGNSSYKDFITLINNLSLSIDEAQLFLEVKGRPELNNYITKHFEDKVPSSIRGKITYYLPIILGNSDVPLSVADIKSKFLSVYDISVTATAVGNSVMELSNCFLFGTRGWGLEEQFRKINESELDSLVFYIVNDFFKKSEDRQWKASEIVESIRDSYGPFAHIELTESKDFYKKIKNLNEYDIQWALLKSIGSRYPKLKYLGRRVWAWSDKNDIQRLLIADLAIKIIEVAGKPLTMTRIKEEILTYRGLGKNFQLRTSNQNKDLIQLSRNEWGLRYRDLNVSSLEEKQIIDEILIEFSLGKFFVDEVCLKSILNKLNISKTVKHSQIARMLLGYVSSTGVDGEFFYITFNGRNGEKYQIHDIKKSTKIRIR
jgi:DNA-directed RNA polymerase alpha subunit